MAGICQKMSKYVQNILCSYEVKFMKEKFKILGRRLKFIRMKRGISQGDMAEMLGLSQTNLSNMESGKTAVTTQNLFKLSEVFKCKISDFFIDFDTEAAEIVEKTTEVDVNLQVLKSLKNVEVKGL